uniref:Protein ARV n=1 Tax=Anthurium amnicola TaxID=1678845 RepID=A0A1D1YQK2_9ARAE
MVGISPSAGPAASRADPMELRCVNCGAGVRRLLVQYSPGNIRLMKCESCKAVADPYVECEFMILLIDLILHKQKAYRHLLFNMPHHDAFNMEGILWKAGLIYFLSDTFRNVLLSKEWDSSKGFLFFLWMCGKMLLEVFCGNFVFFGFLFLSTRILLNNQTSFLDIDRFKGILLVILLSSYFKIFLVAMMVWEFPSSTVFIVDAFVVSSNSVALKVLTQMPTASCVGVLLGAHGFKLFVSAWLPILSSTFETS